MSDEGLVQRGFRISGRVQGVFFRAWTRDQAEELGLRGTVRNVVDGTVEAHVRGPAEQVDEFEARLREGPPAARVQEVTATESRESLPPDSFRILPTR